MASIGRKPRNELHEDAWQLIEAALTQGELKLAGGKKVPLAPGDILRVAQWLASREPKVPRSLLPPMDVVLKSTARSSEPDA